MKELGVNIDHVATLRQARLITYPDPVIAAKMAQDAGADQITCHLREDRRHIQDQDLPAILKAIEIPLNLEMAATEEMLNIALKCKPAKVTLVPEKRQELTTEGGLNIQGQIDWLKPYIAKLQAKGISVSLFIDPDLAQLKASLEIGTNAVEFHTGSYCEASDEKKSFEIDRLQQASKLAHEKGLFVAAGHGLNYQNILPLKRIIEIQEYNIGHSIIAHAVFVGLERAVREMKALLA